jgi:hypothetical protein
LDSLTATEERSGFSQLMDGISDWIKRNHDPRFQKFKEQQIGQVLGFQDDPTRVEYERVLEFKWGDNRDAEHDLISRFLQLHTSADVLSQSQYYFRRFPFRGVPVTRADHCRNMCEFYFVQFYVIRNRLKATMNSLKTACPNTTLDFGRVLKQFDKEFDVELRERNALTHNRPFDALGLSLVTLTGLVAGSGTGSKVWERRHQSAYRTFEREWSQRAKRRGMAAANLIDAIARIILRDAQFLRGDPPAS